MKLLLNIGLITVLMMTVLSDANAQRDVAVWRTAMDLSRICRYAIQTMDETGSNRQDQLGECLGYLQGMDDGFSRASRMLELPPPYCMPLTMKTEQMARIFMKSVDAHPESLHWNAVDFLLRSFREAFPCSKLQK